MITLYDFQQKVLDQTQQKNRVAYFLDMGLGKTFVGSEKLKELGAQDNLLICQISKIDDWITHFKEYYSIKVFNLRSKAQLKKFNECEERKIGIINYDLIFRREITLQNFTLMLDESSEIKHDNAKKTKAILKLNPANVILLSGTPGDKYENLYSQLKLLGYEYSKRKYMNDFVISYQMDVGGFKIDIPVGYKNVDKLNETLKNHGAVFMKTEEVFELPQQNFIEVKVKANKEYKTFLKDKVIEIDEKEFVGSRPLTFMLYLRMIATIYNKEKYTKFKDLVNSTSDRLIVFYNFKEELENLKNCLDKDRPISEINGDKKDLTAYEKESDSVTFIQYQSGSMGLNLQKSNKIIYFSPTLSSDLYEQSKKRTHRIGQERPCFYYNFSVIGSIEENIYKTLEERKSYTDRLFEKEFDI